MRKIEDDLKEVYADICKAAGVQNINDPKVTKDIDKVLNLVSIWRGISYDIGHSDGRYFATRENSNVVDSGD